MAFHLIPFLQIPGPVAVAGPGVFGELYIADQSGLISVYQTGNLSSWLDLRGRMPPLDPSYDERGLIDVVMTPQLDRLIIFYTTLEGRNHLAEVDLKSKELKPLLNILERSDLRNGGRMAFGPEGLLYLGLGDGGHSDNGQNLSSLLGKVLRLDVSQPGGYRIPGDNPFVGYPGLRPEIFAYGFRDPSGVSFNDRGVGYITDAGMNSWEEVNILQKGGNYGWDIREGTEWTNIDHGTTGGTRLPHTPANRNQPFVDPIFKYKIQSPGRSAIIGGASFHDGSYIFGDYSGSLMSLNPEDVFQGSQPIPGYLRAISQDRERTVYIMTSDSSGPFGQGWINRVEKAGV